jgi:hypothetical protein
MRAALFVYAAVTAIAVGAAGTPASAQMTAPLPSEAAEIGACVCLKEASDALAADMAAKQNALVETRRELEQATVNLDAERARMNVNNPEAVARFRQLLEQRDALFRRANGSLFTETRTAVERYNARVNEYNARCANRPTDPVLAARIRSTMTCPPPY